MITNKQRAVYKQQCCCNINRIEKYFRTRLKSIKKEPLNARAIGTNFLYLFIFKIVAVKNLIRSEITVKTSYNRNEVWRISNTHTHSTN